MSRVIGGLATRLSLPFTRRPALPRRVDRHPFPLLSCQTAAHGGRSHRMLLD